MCPPTEFAVNYEINPWMHLGTSINLDDAISQFGTFVQAIQAAQGSVEFLESSPGLPDLVFTANAGIVNGQTFIPAQFRYPQRWGESAIDRCWFEQRGFNISVLEGSACQEGAGDALPVTCPDGSTVLLAGYGFRSDIETHSVLSELLGIPVRSVELCDDRLYHLDLCFCPLDSRSALVAPMGFDDYGMRVISSLVPDMVLLRDEEALSFSANSIVIGSSVIMPSCSPGLRSQIESRGFEVIVTPVDEFLKAGGGCRCLTLALDTVFG